MICVRRRKSLDMNPPEPLVCKACAVAGSVEHLETTQRGDEKRRGRGKREEGGEGGGGRRRGSLPS